MSVIRKHLHKQQQAQQQMMKMLQQSAAQMKRRAAAARSKVSHTGGVHRKLAKMVLFSTSVKMWKAQKKIGKLAMIGLCTARAKLKAGKDGTLLDER